MTISKDLKDRIHQMREENSSGISHDVKVSDNKIKQDNVIEKNKINLDKQMKNTSSNKEQEAFRVLANKFNEAVGVILELTTRVEKLETLVRLQSMQKHNAIHQTEKSKSKGSKIKYLVFFILILSFFYFFNYSKLDFTILNEIFKEFGNILK